MVDPITGGAPNKQVLENVRVLRETLGNQKEEEPSPMLIGDEDLEDIVRHVLIHEIGHHFGFSDEAMGRIEQGAEAALEEGEQWPSNH